MKLFFKRKILGESILIYRKKDSTAVALKNQCPHRFAPLHLGARVGDEIICPYHGLQFNCSGECTFNPHGDNKIPSAMKVKIYPILERYGFLWIWMGEEPADESKLEDYSPLTSGLESSVGYTKMNLEANYKLILDNIMDLSHLDYLHGDPISTHGNLSSVTPKISSNSRSVEARWEWEQTPPILLYTNYLPEPHGKGRHFFNIIYTPPGNIQLSVGVTQSERAALDLNEAIGQFDLHTVTPETNYTAHYFFATRRNYNESDEEYNEQKINAMHKAFSEEDLPIIYEIQKNMGNTDDLFALKPTLMANDKAAVKMRKLLEGLIEDEYK